MKNFSNWLKYGFLLSIPVTLFSVLAPNCYYKSEGEPWNCLIYILPNWHMAYILDNLNMGTKNPMGWIIFIIGGFLTWFIIGALIGIFIGQSSKTKK